MDLTPLTQAHNPIPLHAIAAIASLVIGGVQFALPKGTRLHKYSGYIWVALMAWVAISAFWINEIRLIGPFSPIHLLSFLTLFGLFEAMRTIRNKKVKRHEQLLKGLYFWALIVAGAFTLAPGRVMHQVLFGA